MKVLVTGGTGYIGSHTVVELLEAGHDVVVIDNFDNSHPEVLNRIKQITGSDVVFYEVDATDFEAVEKIAREHQVDAAIHFAGHKAVGESVSQPTKYYLNNLLSTMSVAEAMAAVGSKKLIFSSSATVYGDPQKLPLEEDHPLSATNPYGQTKLFSEQILRDLTVADPEWNISLLRYFNPIGAHESGLIGEHPSGIPNNLLPYVAQVAVGKRDKVSVYGDDYDTHDGTGVRDYIHVVDLAKAHLAALENDTELGASEFNIGTGQGYSVLEIIKAFEKASERPIPYAIVARRPGDIASCYAHPGKSESTLGWKAEKTLEDMVADSWRWQYQNPDGFEAS